MSDLQSKGYQIIRSMISPEEISVVLKELCAVVTSSAGTRNLLHYPWCQSLALRLKTHPQVSQALPENAMAVQCTYFDKNGENNWLVALHQDLSVPVRERVEHAELSGWSEKEGHIFVQPPVELLEQMLAVRVHLDSSEKANGPLRVVPGSHTLGRLTGARAREHRETNGEVTCLVDAGGALLMKPLLLHASSKMQIARPRRVLHFLFGPASPKHGLQWQHAV